MSPRRRLPSSATPLNDDDILAEILVRLPPRPSFLPRASLVCTRRRRIASDPGFLARFRRRHRKPPLLGFFSHDADGNIEFTYTLDPPDSVPAARFFLRLDDAATCCRHGCVLVDNHRKWRHFLVWDPVTGDQRRVDFPPALDGTEKFL